MMALVGKRVYLDSNVFIYAVERVAPYAELLAPLFQSIVSGETEAVTSEIALAEVLVAPIRTANADARTAFVEVLDGPGVDLVPVTRAVLVQAARLRAASRLKLPDAVHAATAQLASCDALLTNDTGIRHAPGVPIVRLADLASGGAPPEAGA